MENHPVEVSIIIPNYNYARFLQQRIESILAQTYTDYEIILLDDASTDDSVSILNHYKTNSCVTCLEINSVNTGSPFAQWQKGISLSRGKYIWIAESDDAAESSFLEKAVSVLNQHPHASFCFLGSHCIDEKGNQLSTDFDRWTSRQLRHSNNMGVFDGEDYIKHNLYWRNYIYNASGVVFRKQCFEQIKDLSCFSMRYSGDWLFWIEMARQGMVLEVYEKLNKFRLHNVSATKKAQKTGEGVREDVYIINKIEQFLLNIGKQRKTVRHGSFYKEIKRLKVSTETKEELLSCLVSSLKSKSSDYYIERFNKNFSWLLPWLITRDKDRL
ncbi:glycosyltransferase [Bacteroides sp. GM023]|uniref:glycosyltransferase family 2 protein n=1 Tax=Bacteroides sp. GM023 TaxID=2723058 RepID=UPI00168BC205|nr:glycosyltransferase [Bacteroides sp. GM023]MBD3588959.1 glycosyltransferase [Bacteroides sp. GM023]